MQSGAELKDKVITTFTQSFGYKPSHIAHAPGRINIIGEHTDYNEGFVLPAAIDRGVYLAGKVRNDNTVNIQSLDFNSEVSFTLEQLRDESLPQWSNYPRGVLWILQDKGHKLRGVDLTISGNVPLGAGFSSSAAIEVGMFEIMSALLGIALEQKQKALLGVEVEHRFIGIRSGAMDQLISALGKKDHALLIDCRSYETRAVPIPQNITLMTLDTGKRRELVNSEYGLRRQQCEEAAKRLGIRALRDLTPEQLAANIDKLGGDEVLEKRAAHVVNEDARTLVAVDALKAGDLNLVGRLLNESHASLRDLYQVSIKELDVMAELAQNASGCYGARMMGGGFGGAVIALVDDAAVPTLSESIAQAYNAATHLQAYIYPVKAGAGSSVEKLA